MAITVSESGAKARPPVIREFRIAAALVAFTNAWNAHRTGALTTIGYVLVASLIIGIFRAWELVGDWNTGIPSSIALLLGHKSMMQDTTDEDRNQGPEG